MSWNRLIPAHFVCGCAGIILFSRNGNRATGFSATGMILKGAFNAAPNPDLLSAFGLSLSALINQRLSHGWAEGRVAQHADGIAATTTLLDLAAIPVSNGDLRPPPQGLPFLSAGMDRDRRLPLSG